VRTIAVGSIARLFALTEKTAFGFFGHKHMRRQSRVAFMFPIAKRLIFGKSASAVGVFLTRFQFNLLRKFGSNLWLIHDLFLKND
jgi:hypothetical protein